MQIRDLALLALPVVTGLNGLIWAETVARCGGASATLCGAVGYAAVAIGAERLAPHVAPGSRDLVWLAMLTTLNALTSALWLVPIAGGTRYVSLALIEGAWPVFSILFGMMLFGRRELDLGSGIGGALILIGSALVFHRS